MNYFPTVFASEFEDHMFAHMLENQDDAELMSLATGQSLSASNDMFTQQQQAQQGCLNDSLLAQLTQQELDSALNNDVHLHDDWILSQEMEKEQLRLKEEEEFKKLQVNKLNDWSICFNQLYDAVAERRFRNSISYFISQAVVYQ